MDIMQQATGVSKAAFLLAELLQQHLDNKETVILGLPGGRTMPSLLKMLARYQLTWDRVHVFFVDERLVPRDHQESNFFQIASSLQQLPDKNIHPFIFDKSKDEKGIRQYQQEFNQFGSSFDVLVVSAGEDGHIASLFPHHPSIKNQSLGFILVEDAPKPPPKRMSISSKLLLQSKSGMILFCGTQKQQAFSQFLDENMQPEECPATLMHQLPQSVVITDF